jgi:hypothetical protein
MEIHPIKLRKVELANLLGLFQVANMIFILQYYKSANRHYNLIVGLSVNQTTGGCVHVTEEDANRR